jgi:hypothetical protein
MIAPRAQGRAVPGQSGRHTLREAVAAGALLSARLSLIIVVAELGVPAGARGRVGAG